MTSSSSSPGGNRGLLWLPASWLDMSLLTAIVAAGLLEWAVGWLMVLSTTPLTTVALTLINHPVNTSLCVVCTGMALQQLCLACS